MRQLGLILNEKRMHPTQLGEFLGIGFDTLRGTFWMSEEKAASLAERANEFLTSKLATPRQLAQFRGKMNWYSVCLEGVALLTRDITKDIGAPTSDRDWDTTRSISTAALDEFRFWRDSLPGMALQAKPIWRLNAEQATARFQERKPGVHAIDRLISLGMGSTIETTARPC